MDKHVKLKNAFNCFNFFYELLNSMVGNQLTWNLLENREQWIFEYKYKIL